ncbi:MAG: GAF domain-containing protein [Rhodospirillaceae bacterium]|nr:MAG: GAF domain-containing protein [Rhodospirillaceae bacterium]
MTATTNRQQSIHAAVAQSDATDSEALKQLIDLGLALSSERNHARLLERILLGAKHLTNADGGTLYLLSDNRLQFRLIYNDSLQIALNGGEECAASFPSLPLQHADGSPNHDNLATYVALTGQSVTIADAHGDSSFDFSGIRAFDARTGYRSKSLLAVPLKNNKNEVLGVLQLINARPSPALSGSTECIAFNDEILPLINALASQAAIALDNQRLLQEQRDLFDAFITMMAQAIDAKSPYTGGHCQRVPVLTEMLAQAACDETEGPLAAFSLTPEQWYELRVAGGLHDVGKVTTPVHILDKATKLEKLHDRIHEVKTRLEILRRDAEIACLKAQLAGTPCQLAEDERDARLAELTSISAFLTKANIGGEFMADADIGRLHQIADESWSFEETQRPLLEDEELDNLSIRRGTLNAADRKIVNDHIVHTIRMLETLPFPKHLRNVAEIAGGHHEKMDGTGYPKGLKRHEMSWLARMMGIADIFEALTACDRPYKAPKTLSESIGIMVEMKRTGHIDPDLFDLFLRSGIYRRYADRFLEPYQIDEVDIAASLA